MALYFYWRHNEYCEPYVYSLFGGTFFTAHLLSTSSFLSNTLIIFSIISSWKLIYFFTFYSYNPFFTFYSKNLFFTFNSYNLFFTLVFLSQQLLLFLCLSLFRSYTPFNFSIWVFFDPTVPLISVFEYILILQSL